MDETQIAENLKQKLPQAEPVDNSYPEPPQSEANDHSNLPLENIILQREIADYLGLPTGFKNNPELVSQLDSVIEWAIDLSASRQPADIMRVLRYKQGEMGIKDKPDKLYRIYQSVKIAKQIDGLFERQRALNG